MLRSECRYGQRVAFKHKGMWETGTITKVNPKRMKVKVDSDGRVWNVPPALLKEDDGTFPAAPPAPPVSLSPILHVGQVVRFKDGGRSKFPVLVVIGQHSGAYRVAPLGGTVSGQYYRGVDSSELEVVNFDLAGV